MARPLSLNVGLPRDVVWKERTVRTGVWKNPVTGRRRVATRSSAIRLNAKRGTWRLPACFFRGRRDAEGFAGGAHRKSGVKSASISNCSARWSHTNSSRALRLRFPSTPAYR